MLSDHLKTPTPEHAKEWENTIELKHTIVAGKLATTHLIIIKCKKKPNQN